MAVKTDSFVFFHIPKTGGSWVLEALRRCGIGGTRIWRNPYKSNELGLYRAHLMPINARAADVNGRFSFCFVRNIIDWYESYWAYRIKNNRISLDLPLDWYCWDIIFEKFVDNTMNYYRGGFLTTMYKLYVGENLDRVDFIGRQENLSDDLIKALHMAGADFDERIIRETGMKNKSSELVRDRLGLSKYTRDRLLDTESWVTNTFYKDI
jgi:hypothetical protein